MYSDVTETDNYYGRYSISKRGKILGKYFKNTLQKQLFGNIGVKNNHLCQCNSSFYDYKLSFH